MYVTRVNSTEISLSHVRPVSQRPACNRRLCVLPIFIVWIQFWFCVKNALIAKIGRRFSCQRKNAKYILLELQFLHKPLCKRFIEERMPQVGVSCEKCCRKLRHYPMPEKGRHRTRKLNYININRIGISCMHSQCCSLTCSIISMYHQILCLRILSTLHLPKSGESRAWYLVDLWVHSTARKYFATSRCTQGRVQIKWLHCRIPLKIWPLRFLQKTLKN